MARNRCYRCNREPAKRIISVLKDVGELEPKLEKTLSMCLDHLSYQSGRYRRPKIVAAVFNKECSQCSTQVLFEEVYQGNELIIRKEMSRCWYHMIEGEKRKQLSLEEFREWKRENLREIVRGNSSWKEITGVTSPIKAKKKRIPCPYPHCFGTIDPGNPADCTYDRNIGHKQLDKMAKEGYWEEKAPTDEEVEQYSDDEVDEPEEY